MNAYTTNYIVKLEYHGRVPYEWHTCGFSTTTMVKCTSWNTSCLASIQEKYAGDYDVGQITANENSLAVRRALYLVHCEW